MSSSVDLVNRRLISSSAVSGCNDRESGCGEGGGGGLENVANFGRRVGNWATSAEVASEERPRVVFKESRTYDRTSCEGSKDRWRMTSSRNPDT